MPITISEREFFTEHIDLSVPALAPIADAAAQGDFVRCRAILADHIRKTVSPEKFFSCHTNNAAQDPDLIAKADRAAENYVVVCGIPHQFPAEGVDWTANPTYNNYCEWPWQLNRHSEWRTLAYAYLKTGDKKYADAFVRLFHSWAEQMTRPDNTVPNNHTIAWRSIEVGIRIFATWQDAYHAFYRDMDDQSLADWCRSVWEHGDSLRHRHAARGNWLIMEMDGLAYISVLYPWMKEADEWGAYAMNTFCEQLKKQVYPDGFQTELATGYHNGVIHDFLYPIRLYKTYGRDVPAEMYDTLRRMLDVVVYLRRPDGRTPDLNDGGLIDVDSSVSSCCQGAFEDYVPPKNDGNHVFENAGIAVLRKDDTYVLFDGGEFGMGHQHEDKLALILYANGRQILTDAGNYAYDTSEMRKYVLSTRAHNTIMVDGQEQNRRRTYKWTGDVEKISDLTHRFTPSVDTVSSFYRDGYGENGEIDVVHTRTAYFVKDIADTAPFVIVSDRLNASEDHHYQVLWHIDAPKISLDGVCVSCEKLDILVPTDVHTGIEVTCGSTDPWQGWIADSVIQFDYRPIPCVSHIVDGADVRHVTVLAPAGGKRKIVKVDAGRDLSDTLITLTLDDGTVISFDEADFLM